MGASYLIDTNALVWLTQPGEVGADGVLLRLPGLSTLPWKRRRR